MSKSFIPTDPVDMSKEKDWPANLGLLDWDNTKVVFTKRSLIEFLKYAGVTVDPNFANIAKLPRYATFGKIEAGVASSGATHEDDTAAGTATASTAEADGFRPTRRVRTVPGGPHTDIFDYEAGAESPTHSKPKLPEAAPPAVTTTSQAPDPDDDNSGIKFSSGVRPSRRVRTVPGGNSSIGSIFAGEEEVEQFKPTRRVRQGPGGEDAVSSIF